MAKDTIYYKVIASLNFHVSNNAASKHIKQNFKKQEEKQC